MTGSETVRPGPGDGPGASLASAGAASSTATAPARAGLVLVSLILVAAVANLNLSVANVALPAIGTAFGSSQTALNLIAVGYSTIEAGAAILPAVVFMVVVAPRSAKLVGARGARFTLLLGYVFLLAAFLWMLLFWKEDSSYWEVALAYVFIGIGVGLAGTPASHSLTGSVPVQREGMASGTADLQRDLGGALLTSVLGALLAAGYAAAMGDAIASSPQAQTVTDTTQSQLQLSYASAANLAAQNPQYASAILAAAKQSFLQGDDWAYAAGAVAIIAGAALVFLKFPRQDEEERLLAGYRSADMA